MYSQKRNCAASVPISTFMCLWAFYVFPESSCSRIGRPILEIYKSLIDTWMWKLGLRTRNFFSGNICFEFLVLYLCSACKTCFTNTFNVKNCQFISLAAMSQLINKQFCLRAKIANCTTCTYNVHFILTSSMEKLTGEKNDKKCSSHKVEMPWLLQKIKDIEMAGLDQNF